MKTLKEVKDHFKNAKEVRCLSDGIVYKLGKIKIDKNLFLFFNEFVVKDKYNKSSIILSNENEFAEIISYKKPKFKYLEKVIASDYEDFSISENCYYACKNTLRGHVIFNENDSVYVYKYIKKIK